MADDEKKRFMEDDDLEMGEKSSRRTFPSPPQTPSSRFTPASATLQNNPIVPVLSYCASSILMTVANKYILSFPGYNLNFFLLAVQVCLGQSSSSVNTNMTCSQSSAWLQSNPARPQV